jgi:hypothetical protein
MQAAAGTKQTPDRHSMPVAPCLTLGSDEQSCPQDPQFVGSLSKLTQLPLQTSGVGIWQESVHRGPADVLEQNGVGAAHLVSHAPQVIGSTRFVSQPSSGREEQCAKPAAQA